MDKKSLLVGGIIGVVLAVAFMYLISIVWAISPPCPIGLIIKTLPANANVGLHVTLKDGSNAIMQGVTNEYGEVIMDVGGVVECKDYTAVILECEDKSACTKTVGFNPSGFTIWDITAVDVPCPTCSDCPTCPTTTTTTLSPTYCEDEGYLLEEDCPVTDWVTLLISAVFGAGAGFGIKSYVNREGKVTTLHKHKGIKAYHDPQTLHNNPLYRHDRGVMNPRLPNK